jgi:hypothetical protein
VGTTPSDRAALDKAVRALVDAIRDGDCYALIDLLSAAAAARLGASRQASVANCKEAFAELKSLGGVTVNGVNVVSQAGARAVISGAVTFEGETVTRQEHFVRENGSWKVALVG